MKRISISFIFSRSFKGIFRAFLMSLTALLLFSCFLLVLGSYGLLHFNVIHNMAGVSAKGQAVIFLEEDCSPEDTVQITGVLDGHLRTGLIREYAYVSATDALRSELEKFVEYPQLYQYFQTGDNPYRASFIVTASSEMTFDEMLDKLSTLTITRIDEAGEIVSCDPVASVITHRKTVAQAESALSAIRNGVMIFELLLLLVCVFVLMNTIRLSIFSQQKELTVMRYLGATHGFLTTPYIWQGILSGLGSAMLAFLAQWLIYRDLTVYVTKQYRMISLLPFEDLWYYLLAAFLFTGLLVGWICGLLATSRYLKDKD